MSNHLAVAGVTATLVQLLQEAVTSDFSGATVSAGRPDTDAGPNADPAIRVFLYRVEPNADWRNQDLPTRNGDGAVLQRPQAALTLQYLLSFIGNESEYAPQRLLGSAVRTLHTHPYLTREEIGRMVQGALDEDPNHPLGHVDLAEQPDIVRFMPLTLSVEDLSNLWSSFFQAECRLSVAYQAAVVLLTPEVSPVRALPVRDRRLFVGTILRPRIDRVVPVEGEAVPMTPGTAVRIVGSQLRGEENTIVRFGEASVSPPSAAIAADRIEATIPDDVRAGAVGLRVEHRRAMGEPPELRLAGQSNVVPIVVHPRIRDDGGGGYLVSVSDVTNDPDGARSGVINLTVDPAVGLRQQVAILLNAIDAAGESFSFFDERRDAPAAPEVTNTLEVAFIGLPAGDYLVRVQVDGAESPLDVETDPGPAQGTYTAPRVTVP
jgi:hypothetical protein